MASTTKNFPVVTNDNDLMLGDGFLFFGGNDEDYDETALEMAGCLSATTTLTTTVQKVELQAGSPQMLIRVEPQSIRLEIKFTLIEINLKRLQKIYGIGQLSTVTANTSISVSSEEVVMYGKFWQRLQHYNILSSPLPVVTLDDAYLTPCTVNVDYQLDRDNGNIRRIPTSAVITNFATVLVSYNYNRPASEQLDFGSHPSIGRYPLKFVVPMPDGRRWTARFWKASAMDSGSLDFDATKFTETTVSYVSLADRTKLPYQLLGSMEKEIEVYYVVS